MLTRRQFLNTAGASTALGLQTGCASVQAGPLSDTLLLVNPFIQPEERKEKRVYDISKPELVVWRSETHEETYPKGRFYTETHGFFEVASTIEKILCLRGFLIRRDFQSTPRNGFYLYFGIGLVWLSLPRRTNRSPEMIQDRYAHGDSRSALPNIGRPEASLSIDYRQFKIIRGSQVDRPAHMVYRAVKDNVVLEVPPELRTIDEPSVASLKSVDSGFRKTLFFDIQPRPLRFKLELPPLVFRAPGVELEMPLPACYFEPFDISTNKWVDQ